MASAAKTGVTSPPVAFEPLSSLRNLQRSDGGWGYGGGGSWTEPTAFALLAMHALADPADETRIRRGMNWLRQSRRADGGWGPRPSVDLSTWAAGVVTLLFARRGELAASDPAIDWLLKHSSRESSFVFRLRRRLLGGASEYGQDHDAWPWFPGTAAWVFPTAITLLALENVQQSFPRADLRKRMDQGRAYLLSRMCSDGGWNHGSSRALGYEGQSYPETTGVALLALHGTEFRGLERSIECAKNHLKTSRSVEASSWLQLGLLAHGRLTEMSLPATACRGVMDTAVYLLAHAAGNGRNAFLPLAKGKL